VHECKKHKHGRIDTEQSSFALYYRKHKRQSEHIMLNQNQIGDIYFLIMTSQIVVTIPQVMFILVIQCLGKYYITF